MHIYYSRERLPLYKPFMPTNSYLKAVDGLKSGPLMATYLRLGITAGSILPSNGIKYCPECIEEDRKLFGHAYLHITHQVPGVFACTNHNCLLKESHLSFNNRNGMLDIDEYVNNHSGLDILPSLTEEVLSMSFDVDNLIRNYDNFGDIGLVKKKYTAQMYERNYLSPKGGICNRVKLQKEFLAFYSNEFLSSLKSDFPLDSNRNWLRLLTTTTSIIVNPVRHLLFIKFLFGDINTFLQSRIEYRPFGEPPFPCLNPQSDHYKELIIHDCQIKTNYNNNKKSGTFVCLKCHYSYTLYINDYEISGFEHARHKSVGNVSKVNRAFELEHGRHLEPGQDRPIINKELEEKYKDELNKILLNDPKIPSVTDAI